MELQVETRDVGELLKTPMVRALWEGMSDGALEIDAKTRQIVAMNEKAQQLLGYTPKSVLGCQCRKIMNSPSCATACPLTALLEGRKEGGALALYYRGREGEQVLHAETRMLLVRGPDGEPLLGIELFQDLREVQALQRALGVRRSLEGLVGQSEVMQGLYQLVEQIAPYDIPVLLTGASGVGKERFADAIQHLSSRSEKPFVKVNCAALSPMLVESELFGHKRGAFTGACQDRRGYLEEADGGTLLLDEVGELPLSLQAKLLRFLQEGALQRLGEDRIRKVDVRVLAATNRSLDEEIEAGRFRADLYYRLLGAHLPIPPLAARMEDLPLLASHLLAHFAKSQQKTHPGMQAARLSPAAMALLVQHDWPGNIRELSHTLQLASIRAQPDGEILPDHLLLRARMVLPMPYRVGMDLGEQGRVGEAMVPAALTSAVGDDESETIVPLAVMEQQAIEKALVFTDGNVSAAARLLGVSRSTLWRRKGRGKES